MAASLGKELRLSRILDQKDQRALIVSVDHGMMLGPIEGVMDLKSTLEKVIAGKPDAVLLTPGSIARFGYLFKGRDKPALIMRADWTNAFRTEAHKTLPALQPMHKLTANVEDALRMGADAVMVFFFVGYDKDEYEARDYEIVTKMARQCEKFNVPLGVEPVPLGPRVSEANYPDLVALASRMAVEAGADFLKVPYTGDVETFRRVVKVAGGAPVLIMGGPKRATDREPLEMLVEALTAGASGAVYGRNVFQSSDPTAAIGMLRGIIHEGKGIDEVLTLYRAS